MQAFILFYSSFIILFPKSWQLEETSVHNTIKYLRKLKVFYMLQQFYK